MDEGLRGICELVQSRTGIQLSEQKHTMVAARLTSRLRDLNLGGFDAYLRIVEDPTNGDELTELVDRLTTNKTSFFREARHYDVLGERMRALSSNGVAPVVWSAGCSSGEEPYSMALTSLSLGIRDTRILATDLSTRMLAHARAGKYDTSEVLETAAQKRTAFFEQIRPHAIVGREARALVSFALLNLLGRWPMRGPFHAIFCRNVMIYFDRPTRERLVERFSKLLAPDGLLFIGLSESLPTTCKVDLVEPGVYRP